jgi:hypothetical protein
VSIVFVFTVLWTDTFDSPFIHPLLGGREEAHGSWLCWNRPNIYGYVVSDPVNLVDPWGFSWHRWRGWDYLERVSDFAAGFGDAISFGATRWARRQLGIDNVVNRCSDFYQLGEFAGEIHPIGRGSRISAPLNRLTRPRRTIMERLREGGRKLYVPIKDNGIVRTRRACRNSSFERKGSSYRIAGRRQELRAEGRRLSNRRRNIGRI